MDWLCPGYNQVLAKQLSAYHGNITAAITLSNIVPIVQTGDLHIAIYDHQRDSLYVANARGDGETGPDMAYDRYIHIYDYPLEVMSVMIGNPFELSINICLVTLYMRGKVPRGTSK